ncbi:MAG: cold shock domain-containing protein [Candidatus Dadabacteria bacterium]|nr:cold shock domain-containing protein [Candidatus Dadabacteria bacterium]NIQ15857.1 cold shock domain-containing protein [Candidatus Dadabacteria bacterium]
MLIRNKKKEVLSVISARLVGKIKLFDTNNKCGFIERRYGSDVFFNIEDMIKGQFEYLKAGDRVEFTVIKGQNGPEAQNIKFIYRY